MFRPLLPHHGIAAGFSLVANLLLLVSPLYMLQVYDRVLVSGSRATLILLSGLALGLLDVGLGLRAAVGLVVLGGVGVGAGVLVEGGRGLGRGSDFGLGFDVLAGGLDRSAGGQGLLPGDGRRLDDAERDEPGGAIAGEFRRGELAEAVPHEQEPEGDAEHERGEGETDAVAERHGADHLPKGMRRGGAADTRRDSARASASVPGDAPRGAW